MIGGAAGVKKGASHGIGHGRCRRRAPRICVLCHVTERPRLERSVNDEQQAVVSDLRATG